MLVSKYSEMRSQLEELSKKAGVEIGLSEEMKELNQTTPQLQKSIDKIKAYYSAQSKKEQEK